MTRNTIGSRRGLNLFGLAIRRVRQALTGVFTALCVAVLTASYAMAADPTPAPTLGAKAPPAEVLTPFMNAVDWFLFVTGLMAFVMLILGLLRTGWGNHGRAGSLMVGISLVLLILIACAGSFTDLFPFIGKNLFGK